MGGHTFTTNDESCTPPSINSLEEGKLGGLLSAYGVAERKVKGDDNCQFRALADQLFGTEESHLTVRKLALVELTENRSRYEAFVPGSFDAYVHHMRSVGTWGDNVTLQACADVLGSRIWVFTTLSDRILEIVPGVQTMDSIACL